MVTGLTAASIALTVGTVAALSIGQTSQAASHTIPLCPLTTVSSPLTTSLLLVPFILSASMFYPAFKTHGTGLGDGGLEIDSWSSKRPESTSETAYYRTENSITQTLRVDIPLRHTDLWSVYPTHTEKVKMTLEQCLGVHGCLWECTVVTDTSDME